MFFRLRTKAYKTVSLLTVLFFFTQQILLAAPPVSFYSYDSPQAEKSAGSDDLSPLKGTVPTGSLGDTSPLSYASPLPQPVAYASPLPYASPSPSPSPDVIYAQERYTVDQAVDLLQPDYAIAVVLESLTEEDAEKLLTLDFETAIIVLDGEIVLFTSGNKNEIKMSSPARELLEYAAFISHVHVTPGSESGPSPFDLENAVEAPAVEYVLTEQGAFSYNRDGIQNGGSPYTIAEYVVALEKARQSNRRLDHSSVTARLKLNTFIKEMDIFNGTDIYESGIFRSALTEGIPAQDLVGYWDFEAASSSAAPDESGRSHTGTFSSYPEVSEDHPEVYYENTSSLWFDGINDMVKIPDTTDINLGTHGERSVLLWFKVEDKNISSRKQVIYEEGAGVRGLAIYILSGRLYVGGWNDGTGESNWSGTYLSTDQIESGVWHAVALTLNGGTATEPDALKAYLDGVEFGSGAGSQLWEHGGNIGIGGMNDGIQFHNGDVSGNGHYFRGNIDEVTIYNRTLTADEIAEIHRLWDGVDTQAPAGSIAINGGADYTNQREVTLTLTAEDDTAIDAMRFSQDGGLTWTDWEPFQSTYTMTLTEGDGLKEILYEIRDTAGNTAQFSDTITLDTTPPYISIVSAALTNHADYILSYVLGGIVMSESRMLENEGANSLSVTATDAAGNQTTETFVVYLDTTPPVIVVKSPALTNNPDYAFAFTFDGVPAIAIHRLLEEGENVFSSTAVDAAGNKTDVYFIVTLDTLAPEIIVLSANETESPVYTLVYTVDGVEVSREENLQSGENSLFIEAEDSAGNVSNLAYTVTYTPPVVNVGAPSVNPLPEYTNQSIVSLSGTKSAGTSIWVNGEEKVLLDELATWSAEVALSAEGFHTLSVTARDAAGHESQAVTVETILDTTPPQLSFPPDSPYLPQGSEPTREGLVGLWDFEAATASSAPDESGHSNTGTYSSYPVISEDHPEVYSENTASLWFDGSNDMVKIPNTTDINLGTHTETSVLVWFKVENKSISSRKQVIYEQGGLYRGLSIYIYNGRLYVGGWNDSSSESNWAGTFLSTDQIESGVWHAVALTLQGGTTVEPDALKAYLDGVEFGSGAGSQLWDHGAGIGIGGKNDATKFHTGTSGGDGHYFRGNIDEVRIYNRTLSGEEIASLVSGVSESQPVTVTASSITVSYLSEGVLKERTFTGLLEGENQLAITEEDVAGNAASLSFSVIYEPAVLDGTVSGIDGTVFYYEAGHLVREVTPEGDEIFYREDGSTEKFRYADGREIRYLEPEGVVELTDETGGAIETISQPVFPKLDETEALRVTMENGLQAYYIDGELVEYQTETGIRIVAPPTLTLPPLAGGGEEGGEITDALIRYPDGKMDVIRGGVLIRQIRADGSIADFLPGGLMVREQVTNQTQFMVYEKTSQTDILGTRIFSADGSESIYDELGILREVTGSSGEHFIYTRTSDGDHYRSTLDENLSTPHPNPPPAEAGGGENPDTLPPLAGGGEEGGVTTDLYPVEMLYDSTGLMLEMTLENGTVITFEEGRIASVYDGDGNPVADYDYLLDGLQVTRSGAVFEYDSNGYLESIATEEGTIHRVALDTDEDGTLTDEEIIQILLDEAGGSRLLDFELDPDGNIVNGIIETREGVKQFIEDGILTGFETVDGRIYDYEDHEALLREWQFRDGTRIIYGGGEISEILFPDNHRLHTLGFNQDKEIVSFTEESADGTQKYFEDNRMVRMITPEGTEIFYGRDGMGERIILTDGSEQSITYICDTASPTAAVGEDGATAAVGGSGCEVAEVVFSGQAAERRFAPDGTLLGLLSKGVSAEIESEEVTRLFTRFAGIESPQFDEDGLMSGELYFVDGTRLVLSHGELVQAVRANGTEINYVDSRVSTIDVAPRVSEITGQTEGGGLYEIIYTEDSESRIRDIRIRLASETDTPEYSLIPYLLNPDTLNPEDDAHRGFGPPIVFYGDARITEEDSKVGEGSLYFDGSVDFIYAPDSPNWTFETGDFTIDLWVKSEDESMVRPIAGQTLSSLNHWVLRWEPGNVIHLKQVINGVTTIDLAWANVPKLNQWAHVALVRHDGDFKLFVNGKSLGTKSEPDPMVDIVAHLKFGYGVIDGGAGQRSWKGYMDQLRVTKGLARWTSDFSPAAETYEIDEYTKLLFHADLPKPGETSLSKDAEEISKIFLSRPAYDVLSDRSQIQSEFDTGDTAYFAKFVMDPERGGAYEFASEYFPEWLNIALNSTTYNGGYVQTGIHKGGDDDAADLTATLIDMDGDGLMDRLYAEGNQNYWWFQKNNGQGFDAPTQWSNVNTSLNSWTLRETAGPSPIFYTDLLDMNHDGLPDRVITQSDNPYWYVQLNNGTGFEDAVRFGDQQAQVLSFFTPEGDYAIETRYGKYAGDIQDLQSTLIDLDGDGYPDRIVRPLPPLSEDDPLPYWHFQKNLQGEGFAAPVLWEGVAWEDFYPRYVGQYADNPETIGASINFQYIAPNGPGDLVTTAGDLIDMNGDNLPDRVLLKHRNPGDLNSRFDWYVQFNNGEGFETPVLWDNNVREVPGLLTTSGTNNQAMATAIQVFDNVAYTRHYLVDLVDVTGDGLPDRVTVDRRYEQSGTTPYQSWWVEENTGTTFTEAVEWTGIYGANGVETSIGQDSDIYHVNRNTPVSCARVTPCYFTHKVDLNDINGDGIPDRILFPETGNVWLVQLGTGHGFLPVEEMTIEGLVVEDQPVVSERYDYLHVSLRALETLTADQGIVRISLEDPNTAESYQEWTIESLATEWQDFYLPILQDLPSATAVRVEFVPAGESPNIPIHVDNVTFTAVRPPAMKDWVDRMLTEEVVLTEIHDERTETLASYLGLLGDLPAAALAEAGAGLPWDQILQAETRISFDPETNEAEEFENLYGSVSAVENGRVVETRLPDNTVITFSEPDAQNPQSVTQTVTGEDGAQNLDLSYGRVRTVSRAEGSPLEYSYEFSAPPEHQVPGDAAPESRDSGASFHEGGVLWSSDEVTVVYDPDTGITERYRNAMIEEAAGTTRETTLLISRTQANGVVTEFDYNEYGELIESRILYKGRVRATFHHEILEEGHQVIVTEEGIREEYGPACGSDGYKSGADCRILYHTTPEGYRYAHSFGRANQVVTNLVTETEELPDGTTFSVEIPMVSLMEDPDGMEIHRVELISYDAAGDVHAEYEKGELRSLILPPTLTLPPQVEGGENTENLPQTDEENINFLPPLAGGGEVGGDTRIVYDRFQSEEVLDPETGQSHFEITLLDVTVFHPDGTMTEFRDGSPFSVTSATGHVIDLRTDGARDTGQETGDEPTSPAPRPLPLLINPSESARFHFDEAMKLWQEVVNPKWAEFQAPGVLPVLSEYSLAGEMVLREYAEGVVELYDEEGRIEQVLAKDGERLVSYTYDEEGNPIGIRMEGSRRRLESAVLRLETEVALERWEALERLRSQAQVIEDTIAGEYRVAREHLLRLRAQLEDQKSQVGSIEVKGKVARSILGDAMTQIEVGLDQINAALGRLADQRFQALEQLGLQVTEASNEIETQTEAAYAGIRAESEKGRESILKQELMPVIHHWYRKLLGRDPSQAEYESWIETADYESDFFDLEALKTALLTSDERAARQAEVDQIRAKVREEIENYLTLTEEEKIAFAVSLGFQEADVISSFSGTGASVILSAAKDLTSSEAQSILTWMDNQSLHFGQSAFLALESMLKGEGAWGVGQESGPCLSPLVSCPLNRVALAVRLILIDILTGTLTPVETTDLVISMYAMRLTARYYGLTGAASYAMTYDALTATFRDACLSSPAPCPFSLIAHVSGNHYIVITNVTDSEVSYIDPGAGSEDALEVLTMTKEQFLQVWVDPAHPDDGFGYVLSPRPPPEGQDAEACDPELAPCPSPLAPSFSVLSTEKEMSLRGSFFSLIVLAIIAVAQAVIAVVSTVVAAVMTIVSALISAVGSFLSGLGSMFSGFFSSGFFTSLQGFFGGILQGLGNLMGGIVGGIVKMGEGLWGMLSAFNLTLLGGIEGFVGAIPVIGGPLAGFMGSMGGILSYGLIGLELMGAVSLMDAVGISPKISGSVGAGLKIALGIGLLATGNPVGISFIGGGASEMLSLHTTLPPVLTNIIGIGAAALGVFAGDLISGGSLAGSLEGLGQLAPHLAMDLASAGLTGIGNALGMDPRITALIGVPVRATVGGITGNALGLDGYGDVLGSIVSDTVGGLVSVGAQIGLNEIGVPPVLNNFIPVILGSLVANAGSAGGDGPPTTEVAQAQGQSIWNKIQTNVTKFGSGLASAVSDVVSFGTKVIEGIGSVTKAGFAKAVNFFSGIFDRQTQETLIQAGNGSIENAILNSDYIDLGGGVYRSTVNFGGETITIDWNGNLDQFGYDADRVTLSATGLDKIGQFFSGSIVFAQEIQDGIMADQRFVNGEVVDLSLIENSEMKYRVIKLADGEEVLPISITPEGIYYNIPLKDSGYNFQIIGNGFWNDAYFKNMTPELSASFIANVTSDMINAGKLPIPLKGYDGLQAYDLNGNLLTATSLPVTLYETTGFWGNVWSWAQEAFLGNTTMTQEVASELRDYFVLVDYNIENYGLDPAGINYTYFAHSGNFLPLLQAIDQNPEFRIKTLISYEGPDYVGREISNPYLERMIFVNGTRSSIETNFTGLLGAGSTGLLDFDINEAVPFLGFREYTGVDGHTIDNIYIEIKGAGHTDFVYNPYEPDPIKREISRKTNLFMRELNTIANDGLAVSDFLTGGRQGITYDEDRNVYVIDPIEFESSLE